MRVKNADSRPKGYLLSFRRNKEFTQKKLLDEGVRVITPTMNCDVQSFELPPIGTQCYVVSNPVTAELAVFDAPLNAFATVERMAAKSGYTLSGLYFTHGHWDHTLDGWRFAGNKLPIIAHAADQLFFESPRSMSAFAIPGMEMKPVPVTQWVKGGEDLMIAGLPVEVREVPGHSPGSVLFWFKSEKFAISGDAIFRGSIGRTDFPGCSFEELARSIRTQIYSLPDETILYPGHGPQTTVADEARHNPFVSR